MTTDTGTFRYFGYRNLVIQQANKTAAYAESLSPPRALTDDEINATLEPNLQYYIGTMLRRQSSNDNPDSTPLSLEHINAQFEVVVKDIGYMVNCRFVAVAEMPLAEEPMAEVIPLFPASQNQEFAATG